MWNQTNQKLTQTFQFADFSTAFSFMTQVAMEAEKMNHHPWWSNVYNQVTIELCTHEAGDTVTDKDIRLSQAIDRIWKFYQPDPSAAK